MTTEIAKGIYDVGVVDWELRRFHGHELSTHRGSSYNSYLIVDRQVTLVDTVWNPYADRLIENISQVVDPGRIDVVVVNHAETDHSGSLPAVMRRCPNATVVVSKRGAESVPGHFHQQWKFKTVQNGERLSIGDNELVFIEATMLHWPDSMFTYLPGTRILLSNDAFGEHYAAASRFNDEVDQGELFQECLKYYTNILTPFSHLVAKKIDELTGLALPIDVIAPSHGVIWRKDPLQIVRKYAEWAAQKPGREAVILYETMWDGTRRMAEAIGDGLRESGVGFKIVNAAVSDRNDVMVDIFKAGAVIVGSPTFNNGILPTIWPVLQEMKGLKFKHKLGAAFGSYGWSGEGIGIIKRHLEECGFAIAGEGVKCKWQPDAEALEKCRSLGIETGRALLKGMHE